jgi:hypothetical protein
MLVRCSSKRGYVVEGALLPQRHHGSGSGTIASTIASTGGTGSQRGRNT